MAICGAGEIHARAHEISRRPDAKGAPKIRDYRQSQGVWPFTAEWFWGVNFVSSLKPVKCNQWNSFSWLLSFAPVIDKLRKMLSQMKHYALFILIRPGLDQIGRHREEKLQPFISKKKWVHIAKNSVARDARNLLQLSPKVLFQRRANRSSQRAETEFLFCTSSVQTILCSGQAVTYRC